MKGLQSTTPARIRALPERLANQIAAGEVVERPASVLKELLENSLDAGAHRIQVDVENGGERLIRVRDDGVGIHRDDLALALGRHATSKIASLDDLENVATLGFRGEALPSIASVSRLELCSCTQGEESGWKLVADARLAGQALQPVAHPVGTTVSVRDLFYNTPARRKFLRTERTEYRHLEDVLKRAALSRFDCGFSLRHNGRESYSLPVASSEAECARRVAKLCGTAFVDQALSLSFESPQLQISGWVGAPGYSRGVSDLQYLFVNGRMVRDNLLRHAVRHAHHGIVDSGRQPAYVLFLLISPAEVDVNVHPSKHEVRFRDARSVHDFIVQSLRKAFTMDPGEGGEQPRSTGPSPMWPVDPGAAPRIAAPHAGVGEHALAYDALRTLVADGGESAGADRSLGEALEHVDRRYVLARNGRGMVVVDARRACRQVAAAELAAVGEDAGVAPRPLLVPVAVQMDESQAELLERRAPELERLGFDLRRVARTAISCRGVPAPLAAAAAEELVLCLAGALARTDADARSSRGLPEWLETVLGQCDLTAGWTWHRDTMNVLLRQMERLAIVPGDGEDEAVWRQLTGEDMAALLERRRP
jgi:DNA mismatch repair protein MutL